MRLRRALWLGRVYVYEVWQWGDAALGMPLTAGRTGGGIRAAHGPQEKFRGGIGVPPNPRCDQGRYRGRPGAPAKNLWGNGSVPLPEDQLTDT